MRVGDRVRRGYRSLFSRRRAEPAQGPEEYERRALAEIDRLKNPEPSRLGSALDAVHKPVARAASTALEGEVGKAISSGVQGLMDLLSRQASWSVRRDVVYEQFRSSGHPEVHEASDIRRLELREVDEAVGHLAAKSESLAFVEGAGTGTLGLAGTAIDVPGLMGIALRSVSEYATYYGFDASSDDEKAFVLMLLAAVSAPTVDERRAAMTELTRLSVMLAGKESRSESGRLFGMQMVTKFANTIVSRLVKAKMAQAIPVVGAGIAAAFNAWFLRTVTQSAFQLYRERFLIEKHGPQVAVPVRDGAPSTS
jgi:hypothetical protein